MSLFRALADKLRAMHQKSLNKTSFQTAILDAVSDGKLTPEEIQHLDSLRSEFGLGLEDLSSFRTTAYLAAYQATKRDGDITAEEERELQAIQTYLQVPDAAIEGTKRELARFRILREVRGGNLPSVPVDGLVLQKNEVSYWREPASLLEEKVVSRRYEGGSHGVSIRIAKGVSYRVGAQRGRLVSDRDVVPVSPGDFIVTSRRVIFRGLRKGFNTRLDKLLNVQLFSDGILLTDGDARVRIVKFNTPGNADIIQAIIAHAVNNFSARPVTTA